MRIVHVISGDLWAGAEAQAYALLKHLSPLCDNHAILLNHGPLADKLRACKVPVTVLDETILNSWQILNKIRLLLKDLKPDVVHTHRQKENILGALANRTSINVRSIRTVHGAPEFSGNWKTSLLRKIDQWTGLYLQNAIIAVSPDLKKQLLNAFPERKLRIIENGVDVDALNAASKVPDFRRDQPDKTHVGIIGRLNPVKRIDLFLEAAALISMQPDQYYHFHVIGDGPLRIDLERQAHSLGISGNVTFHGHRDDIPDCIKFLDTVVMCSDHEGMPMVALETIALGTKLVAHNVGGLRSLAEKHSIIVYSPNQATLLQQAIQKECPNPELDDAFKIETCARETFQLYQVE